MRKTTPFARAIAQAALVNCVSVACSESARQGNIRCTFVYRESSEIGPAQTGQEPMFQFQERVATVAPEQQVVHTLGRLTLTLRYDTDSLETDSVSLNVSADGRSLLSILYQLGDGLPLNQFSGRHGFTGLLYLTHPTAGGDYQVFCEAVPVL